ncbi:hypothetical protein HY025_04955 [Candidatus Daviesbacteria bacterium]|nr:hypothetical protein [Candidatus Daviesbacteria bacterium]
MDEYQKNLTPLAEYLLSELDKNQTPNHDRKLSVNPVVSEVATWYEKFRNAMDNREDDVLLRAAIERILKRRLLLGGTGQGVAQPLIRELLWARYFPEATLPESTINQVEQVIDHYLKLQHKVLNKHKINRNTLHEWIMQLMSAEIEHVLNPNPEKELMSNFMFQTYRSAILIADDSEEVRDVQVFIAVHRTFAKEDLALLRYNLFNQLFGKVTVENIEKISDNFVTGIKEIESQLSYSLKDKIYTFIKRQTVPFFILEDVFRANKGRNKQLVSNLSQFNVSILDSCSQKYKGIKAKVQRAIVRGVIFIFVTKAVFALAVEGTYESLIYGQIIWSSIALNTLIPPVLMIIVGLLIKTPDKENSIRIAERIHSILFSYSPVAEPLTLKKAPAKTNPLLMGMFILLWLLAFGVGFGSIIFVLTMLHFNLISQAVFLFFLTIVSFISFRINQTAHIYSISDNKQNFKSVLFDFFFMPFIQLGRRLTEDISKINIFLFVFDFIIEAPFKGIFAFFEQWFYYLRTQREKLG